MLEQELMSDGELQHDITDEYGYWWNGSLQKNINGKNVDINKETIDTLIEYYKKDIAPHKRFLNEVHQEIVDYLTSLKRKLNW
jgi:hypothetical protein